MSEALIKLIAGARLLRNHWAPDDLAVQPGTVRKICWPLSFLEEAIFLRRRLTALADQPLGASSDRAVDDLNRLTHLKGTTAPGTTS